MSPLVLLGLLLIASGIALLVLKWVPARRRRAAAATQPRTVADLVRLRVETAEAAPAGATSLATPAAAPAARVGDPAVASASAAQAWPAATSVATAPAEPVPVDARVPALVAQADAEPVANEPITPDRGSPRTEPEPASRLPLGRHGDDAPWQRAAWMAAGFAGGQPWPKSEPTPAPVVPEPKPAPVEAVPLRIVPSAQPHVATAAAMPAADTASEEPTTPVRPAQPFEAAPAEPVPVVPDPAMTGAPRPGGGSAPPPAAGPAPDQLAVDQAGPAVVSYEERSAERATGVVGPVARDSGCVRGVELGLERADVRSAERVPGAELIEPALLWEEPEPEVVRADAVPDRFADEGPAESASQADAGREIAGPPEAGAVAPAPARQGISEQVPVRRGRPTPDERAAEQAAADLALLRTFGFVEAGLRPDSAPVVAMAGPQASAPPAPAWDAQPVRYRVVRRDGTVVANAAVTLLDHRGGDVAAGIADAEGRGEVLAPTRGSYVLVSTAICHQPGAVAITVAGSPTHADVLLARSASVSGTVNGEDGPIAGVRVTLVQDGEVVEAVDTDGVGAYRIGDIGAGEYGLSVVAPGCEPVATLLDVAEEADVHRNVDLAPASPVADADDPVPDDVMSGQR